MGSPFPGMDPFLEHPGRFSDFHDQFLGMLRIAVQAVIPPPYRARLGRRTWLSISDRSVEPDVGVVRRSLPHGGSPNGPGRRGPAEVAPNGGSEPGEGIAFSGAPSAGGSVGGATILTRPAPSALEVPVPTEEDHELVLEVYEGRDPEARLITAIEVLSPGNKRRGAASRESYLRKQVELLRSAVHLVEVDWLRAGSWTTAIPEPLAHAAAGAFDYHVSIRRRHLPDKFLLYPLSLDQPLPTIALSLCPKDGAVPVDLQALFSETGEAADFAGDVDYLSETPQPRLTPAQQQWSARILAAAAGQSANPPGVEEHI